MGLDQIYRAVPRDSPLIPMAIENPSLGTYLELFGLGPVDDGYAQRRQGEPDFAEYVVQSMKSRETNEGIAERTLDIGRRWDMLLYLLSETRRQCLPPGNNELSFKAVIGGSELNEQTITIQGIPIRHLPPDEVRDVFFWLNDLPPNELDGNWDPAKMHKAGVYKIHPVEPPQLLEYLKEDLDNLAHFYTMAYANDEGVLAFCG